MTTNLGAATYDLIFNSAEANAGIDATEANVNQATTRIGEQLSLVDASFGKVGAAAGMMATEVTAASAKGAAGAAAGAAEQAAAANKTALSWERAAARIKTSGKIGGQMGHLLGLGAAYFAIHGGIEWLKEANAGWLQVKNSIAATGGVAAVTAGHASELADKWEELTGAARGETLQTESLLLRFKNIRNVGTGTAAIFDRTLTQIENIHAATGRSIQAVTAQVGKAIQDPTKYLGLLGRAGITFSVVQQKMVKHIALTSGTLAAQKYVLAELDKRYHDAAITQGKTFIGQMKIAKAQVDANSAAILTVLIPSFVKLVGIVRSITDVMRGHANLLKQVVLAYIGFRIVLYAARTAIIAVETAQKIATALTWSFGTATKAATVATTELGTAEVVTGAETTALGNKAVVAGAKIDGAAASTRSFRTASILAGTTLGGLLGPLAIAAAAYATLAYFASQANQAVTNLNQASAHEGSDRVAELAYYAQSYKNNIKKGMSPAKARAAAAAATNVHAQKVGLPAFDVHDAAGEAEKFAKAPPKVISKAYKFPKGTALIPVALQIAEARAGLTTDQHDDVKAYQNELTFLKSQLTKHKLTKNQELTVLQEMATVKGQLDTSANSIASKARAAAAKLRVAAAKAAALEKKKKAAAWKLLLVPPKEEMAYLKAQQTVGLADDLKTLNVLKDYYEKLLKNRKLTADQLLQAQKKLTAVTTKIFADKKKAHLLYLQQIKEVQAAENLRGTFFGDFAANVFHHTADGLTPGAQKAQSNKTVKVDQHNTFNEIPADRHLLSNEMKRATEAALG